MAEDYNKINYKAICCEEIPEVFLDKLVAKKHFTKFGRINRFILRPKRLSCTVEYETEDAAERALTEAGHYNGYDFQVIYAEHEIGHVQNTEEWVDPDVQAELDAMNPNRHMTSSSTVTSRQTHSNALSSKPATALWAPKSTAPASKSSSSVRSELEMILQRPALSDEEKFRVLDARDKLIRLNTVKETDIKKAKINKGSCPDMCPEKERFMRSFQRQVATFEMNDNYQLSHKNAVKEYSRSSADQEVPLAHELRSESVLKMTMLYLIRCIVHLCDEPDISIADWFHFMWDRTRSIRKDITQQELCSLDAVELVEQCARFHIHCAARLIAEDPSVFDKKINAENLTKCLQTLKYMYHDLRLKNIVCPCETEFRGYIILLNLNNSNFLWELGQLPEEIQSSPEIKRAIAFHNAFQNNNYVRFFTMIRSPDTSYLNACLLLGYFHQLRYRAMETIVKSHAWRKASSYIPLTYLTEILGFDDEDSSSNFFEYHGLQCDDRGVLLERLKQPDLEYCMDRSIDLVESKRQTTIGECIFGGPLPTEEIFETHQPHNSFDDSGILRPEAWTADDQLRGDAAIAKAAEKKNYEKTKSEKPLNSEQDPNINHIFKKPLFSTVVASGQQQPQQQQQISLPPPSQMEKSDPFGLNMSRNSIFKSPAKDDDDAKTEQISKPIAPTATKAFFDGIFKQPAVRPLPKSSSSLSFHATPPMSGLSGMKRKHENIFGQVDKQSLDPVTFTPMEQPIPKDSTDAKPKTVFGLIPPTLDATFISNEVKNEAELKKRAEIEQHQKRIRELEEAKLREQREYEKQKEKLRLLEEQQELNRKLREKERQLMELRAKVEKESNKHLSVLLTKEIYTIANDELQKYQKVDEQSKILTENLLKELVAKNVNELACDEYATMCEDKMLLHNYFYQWTRYVAKKVQQRKNLESTPIWVTTETREEQTEKVAHPKQDECLQMIKRYRRGEPCNFRNLLLPPENDIQEQVDLFYVIKQLLLHYQDANSGPLGRKYFKFVISLPSELDEIPGFESLTNDWLRNHVYIPATNNNDKYNPSYLCACENDIALCLRKLTGVVPINERGESVTDECERTNGVIFFMSCAKLDKSRIRLSNLLEVYKIAKTTPISFVVYNNSIHHSIKSRLCNNLELQEMEISNFRFYGNFEHKTSFDFANIFIQAVRYIVRQCTIAIDESDRVERSLLQDFLETNIGEEMWQRWHQSSIENPAFYKICSEPYHIVGIYNEGLQRLREIVKVDFSQLPDFPIELQKFVPITHSNVWRSIEYFPSDWKSTKRQKEILELLKRLQLPPPPDSIPNNRNIQFWLIKYSNEIIPNNEDLSTKSSLYAVKAWIKQFNRSDLQELENDERIFALNFLSVIKPLVFAHVNNILKQFADAKKFPADIFYKKENLLAYQEQPWWLNYKPIEEVKLHYNSKFDFLIDEEMNEDEFSEKKCREIEAVLENAEAVVRRVDENLAKYRQETFNSCYLDPQLTRSLNENIYKFEIAKRCGVFDISNEIAAAAAASEDQEESNGNGNGNENRNENEKENCENQQQNHRIESITKSSSVSTNTQNGKRKRSEESISDDDDEVNDVLKNAYKVIAKVNAHTATQERLRKAFDSKILME